MTFIMKIEQFDPAETSSNFNITFLWAWAIVLKTKLLAWTSKYLSVDEKSSENRDLREKPSQPICQVTVSSLAFRKNYS